MQFTTVEISNIANDNDFGDNPNVETHNHFYQQAVCTLGFDKFSPFY